MSFTKCSSAKVLLAVCLALFLSACGSEQPGADTSTGSDLANTDTVANTVDAANQTGGEGSGGESKSAAQGSDPQEIVKLYQQSCIACHNIGAAGAPRTGDVAAWGSRIAEVGMDGLVANSISGIGAMPPKGLCGQCTERQIRDLIVYMSSAPGQ